MLASRPGIVNDRVEYLTPLRYVATWETGRRSYGIEQDGECGCSVLGEQGGVDCDREAFAWW